MVIVNGHIELIGGENEGLNLECCYQENSRSPMYATDGSFINANYTAMIEDGLFPADGCRLFDIEGNDLGLFQISNIRRADQVGAYIYVLTRHDN